MVTTLSCSKCRDHPPSDCVKSHLYGIELSTAKVLMEYSQTKNIENKLSMNTCYLTNRSSSRLFLI